MELQKGFFEQFKRSRVPIVISLNHYDFEQDDPKNCGWWFT